MVRTCNYCNAAISGHGNKKYCSIRCKNRVYYLGRKTERPATITCLQCGAHQPYTRNRKFCNVRCKNAFNAIRVTDEARKRYAKNAKARAVKRAKKIEPAKIVKVATKRAASMAEAQQSIQGERYA